MYAIRSYYDVLRFTGGRHPGLAIFPQKICHLQGIKISSPHNLIAAEILFKNTFLASLEKNLVNWSPVGLLRAIDNLFGKDVGERAFQEILFP